MTTEALGIILQIFPGLWGTAIFCALTPVRLNDLTSSIILALILLGLTQYSAPFLSIESTPILITDGKIAIGWAAIKILMLASLFAIILAGAYNKRFPLFKLLAKIGITKKGGAESVFNQLNYADGSRWVRIELEDNRIIVGYIKYFSDEEDGNDFYLGKASICTRNEDGSFDETPVEGGIYFKNFDNIKLFEFLNRKEKPDE